MAYQMQVAIKAGEVATIGMRLISALMSKLVCDESASSALPRSSPVASPRIMLLQV